jgi:hypothetical protein
MTDDRRRYLSAFDYPGDPFADLRALAARPECIHHLNGPCRECGPSLNADEARAFAAELAQLTEETT